MSRSKKGSKGPGYDYWSKRPHSGMGHGPEVKKLTHSVERQQAKTEITEELEQAALDNLANFRVHPVRFYPDESRPKGEHNWSGWPGAYCLTCGLHTDDYYDPEVNDGCTYKDIPECKGRETK